MALPDLIEILLYTCTLASLMVLFMNVFEQEMAVLDVEIFPQQNISSLTSSKTLYQIIQSASKKRARARTCVCVWSSSKWRVTLSGELMFLESYSNCDVLITVTLLL